MSIETTDAVNEAARIERVLAAHQWIADNVPKVTAQLALDTALGTLHKGSNEAKGDFQRYMRAVDPTLLEPLLQSGDRRAFEALEGMRVAANTGVDLSPRAARRQLPDRMPVTGRIGYRAHELGLMLNPIAKYPAGDVAAALETHAKLMAFKDLVGSGVHLEPREKLAQQEAHMQALAPDVKVAVERAGQAAVGRQEAKGNLRSAKAALGGEVVSAAGDNLLAGAGVAGAGVAAKFALDLSVVDAMLTALGAGVGGKTVSAIRDRLRNGGGQSDGVGAALGEYSDMRTANRDARREQRKATRGLENVRKPAKGPRVS